MLGEILAGLSIIAGLSMVVLYCCHRAGIPTLVSFILVGIAAGPNGFGLIQAEHEVELVAEIGVILLLFTIGLEFSFNKLIQIKRNVFVGGTFQVFSTIVVSMLLLSFFTGYSINSLVFIGFFISLSSTAIVMKLFQESGEVDTPQGRNCLSILLFQDLIVVPMMIFTPLLAGELNGGIATTFFWLFLKGSGIVLLVWVGIKWFVPRVLHGIVRTRNRELFLLCIVFMCIGIAWITHELGLSIALGAFLAGLIISESEYSHQAFGNILPFRDIFTSIFFISIGMLFEPGVVFDYPLVTLGLVVFFVFVKFVLAGSAAFLSGYPLRTSLITGISLAQVGEFSFILLSFGSDYNLVPSPLYQILLASAIITMALTPFLIQYAHPVADRIISLLSRLGLFSGKFTGDQGNTGSADTKELKDHVIIVGYGVIGSMVARACIISRVPYAIIEMNPRTVKEEKEKGENIVYGDSIQAPVLENIAIKEARVLVVTIPDRVAVRKVVAVARQMNPEVHIIARTRFVAEIDMLSRLGANEVITEEYEIAMELFSLLLKRYLISEQEILRLLNEMKAGNYSILRSKEQLDQNVCQIQEQVPDLKISTFKVQEESELVGKTLNEIDLRQEYGVTLIAIQRSGETIVNPSSNTYIQKGDIITLIGDERDFNRIRGKV
mgnify:CR=1 FL=1